jgi:trk system potassium uptake protein TrkH
VKSTIPSQERGGGLMGSLLWAYILMIAAGFCMLRLPISTTRGNEITVDRAIFSTINAATLTGFQQARDVDTYKLPGQITILALTIGGTLFALIGGGLALVRIMRLPYGDEYILKSSILIELIVLLIGWLGGLLPNTTAFASVFQTTSAFGNSGVWIGGLPNAMQPTTHLFYLPLAIVGGLGVPVLLEIGASIRGKRKLAAHSWTVLVTSAVLYLVGVIALLCVDGGVRSVNLARASAISINARSPGLPIVATFSRVATWLLLLWMMIGGNSGSAGGGLKATTVVRFFRGAWEALRGRNPGRGLGIAIVWIVSYLAVVGVAMLVLLGSEPDQSMDRLLMLAISAMSNVGMSHEPVSVVGIGLHTLSTVMLVGRLAPLFVLWWVAKTTDEQIGIG